MRSMRRGLADALGAVVGLVVLVSAGTWVYLNVLRDPTPDRLPLDAADAETTTIPITFADYGIDNPSAGPAQVGDEGELEFLLVLGR